MTLNKLLNTLLTEGPYQNEVADILADLNMGKRQPAIRVEEPPLLVVDGVEIPITQETEEAMDHALWVVSMERTNNEN